MKKHSLLALAALFAATFFAQKTESLVGKKSEIRDQKSEIQLPTGWFLTPAGRGLPLGDLPLNMALSPSKKRLAVVNCGQGRHSVQVISTKTEAILWDFEVPTAWLGCVFEDENSIWISAGNENRAFKYQLEKQAAGTPTTAKNEKAFEHRPSKVNLDDRNVANTPLSRQFDGFDFSGEDRVPDLLFNQLLWKAIRGEDSEMPAPRRAAWLRNLEEEEGEDEEDD